MTQEQFKKEFSSPAANIERPYHAEHTAMAIELIKSDLSTTEVKMLAYEYLDKRKDELERLFQWSDLTTGCGYSEHHELTTINKLLIKFTNP